MKIPEIIDKLESDWSTEYFNNSNQEPFVTIDFQNQIRTFNVNSGQFTTALMGHLFCKYKYIPAPTEVEKIISIIRSKSRFEGPQKKVCVRCGWSADKSEIYYHLGGKCAQIDKYGVKLISKPPIPFVQYGLMSNQVEPDKLGDIKDILKFTNISADEDKLLFLVFLVSCFIPDIPHPILALHGIQGSAKSTLTRYLIELIDPSPVPDTQTLGITEFLQTVSHRWVTPLDNQTHLSNEYSDLLCKVVTGTGFSKRVLYTNNDDFIQHIQRIVIINGINLPISKSDILDRCLLIELERIKDDNRKDEGLLNREFELARPGILGGCLRSLSIAMELKPNIKLDKKPRLADFALWGCAIAKALGKSENDFINAFNKNITRQHREAIAASPLAETIVSFMGKKNEYSTSMTEALTDLVHHAISKGQNPRMLPQSPRSFGKKVRELIPNLQTVGLIVVLNRTSTRNIRIFWENGEPS